MIDLGAELQRAFDEGYERGKAERPQGHWEIYIVSPFDGEDCKCSECGTDINARSTLFIKFCPYCGAKMDQEERK